MSSLFIILKIICLMTFLKKIAILHKENVPDLMAVLIVKLCVISQQLKALLPSFSSCNIDKTDKPTGRHP